VCCMQASFFYKTNKARILELLDFVAFAPMVSDPALLCPINPRPFMWWLATFTTQHMARQLSVSQRFGYAGGIGRGAGWVV
jgi:hypothetical protein